MGRKPDIITRTCIARGCRASFVIDWQAQRNYARHGQILPLNCPSCRAARRAVTGNKNTTMTIESEKSRVCVDCRGPFVLTQGEVSWFALHDYQLPKRCKACREWRRGMAAIETYPGAWIGKRPTDESA